MINESIYARTKTTNSDNDISELDELKHSEVIHQIDKKMYFMTTIARSRTTDESPEKNTSTCSKCSKINFY